MTSTKKAEISCIILRGRKVHCLPDDDNPIVVRFVLRDFRVLVNDDGDDDNNSTNTRASPVLVYKVVEPPTLWVALTDVTNCLYLGTTPDSLVYREAEPWASLTRNAVDGYQSIPANIHPPLDNELYAPIWAFYHPDVNKETQYFTRSVAQYITPNLYSVFYRTFPLVLTQRCQFYNIIHDIYKLNETLGTIITHIQSSIITYDNIRERATDSLRVVSSLADVLGDMLRALDDAL